MPLTHYSLDRFVSPELSRLTACNAPEVASCFSQSAHWISNFVMNSIFGYPVEQEARRFAFAFLRRAEAAFEEYECARNVLIEFTSEATSRKSSVYFRALKHFESTVAKLWQACGFMMRLTGEKLFQKGDDSKYERLNLIYNVSRHLDPARLHSGDLHAVWITNHGVQIKDCELSYAEVESFLVEVGGLADRISTVSFFEGVIS